MAMTGGQRLWGTLVSVAFVGAMAWPLIRDEDGFPLSNYPMFAKAKGEVATVYHVVGFTADGRARPMPIDVLATDEIMQAFQTVRLAMKRGTAAQLCEEVATVVASSPALADIERLEVRRDTFDVSQYFTHERRRSTNAQIGARCDVVREESP